MVAILLVGLPCSGKDSVVNYLITNGFKHRPWTYRIDETCAIDATPTSDTFIKSSIAVSQKYPSYAADTSPASHETLSPASTRVCDSSVEAVKDVFTQTSSLSSRRQKALKRLSNELLISYKDNIVVTGLTHLSDIFYLRSRPFVLTLAVDAPLAIRFSRSLLKYGHLRDPPPCSLDAFVSSDHLISTGCVKCSDLFTSRKGWSLDVPSSQTDVCLTEGSGILYCIQRADIVIDNSGSLERLYHDLSALRLDRPTIVRPDYDAYFMQLALETAMRSNCLRRAVGAVLTVDNKVVATGYNGSPTGCVNCLDGGCSRCLNVNITRVRMFIVETGGDSGEALEDCICVHAEANALLQAGVERSQNGILYVTCFPCLGCAKLIAQGGIARLVFLDRYDDNPTTVTLLKQVSCSVTDVQRKILVSQYAPLARKRAHPMSYSP